MRNEEGIAYNTIPLSSLLILLPYQSQYDILPLLLTATNLPPP